MPSGSVNTAMRLTGVSTGSRTRLPPSLSALATGGNNGVVRLWNLNVSYAIKRICTVATNELTPQQWHTYIPQEPYQPPCAQSEP